MKRLIFSFLFIYTIGFGQSNLQTDSNANDVLSIKPKESGLFQKRNLDLIKSQVISNSSSIFWVEPRIRDNYEPPALPIIERSNNEWCGTMPWWEERNSGQRSCDFYGITDDPAVRDTYIPDTNTETINFRLFIHAFADDNGETPTTTLADAEAQLLSLNDTYSSYNIQFNAWFQIHNDSQFQSLTSTQWSSGEIKESYAMDPTMYHNVYVTDSNTDWGILGVSTFPWDSEALTVYGGTFIDKDWFGAPRTFSGTADVPNHTATHEFGHALHGMLSDVTYPSISGTSVNRDFVELPSQLYEHWLNVPEVLQRFAVHHQTGEAIPQPLLEKMRAAENFNKGFANVVSEFVTASGNGLSGALNDFLGY